MQAPNSRPRLPVASSNAFSKGKLMKLNDTLLAQMRAATRAMFGKGPPGTTTTVMEETLKNASVVQQALRDLSLPLSQPASNQPTYDPARMAEQIVPELL